MARSYKRDNRGRFARAAGGAKKRYQKGQTGKGAIHRRRRDQWNSGRKRDKAKVILKSGSSGGAAMHAVSAIRNRNAQNKGKRVRR